MKTITKEKTIAGLFVSQVEYEVTKETPRLLWTGPKFTLAMWKQVLAFFQWTQETAKSESQVRLFCNSKLGEWRAWAFPQKAKTGMTSEELDTPEAKQQRAQFGDDWLYLGTVHHHCTASAFQSGTDLANEESQDGIHITVGNLESNQLDIHARFYLEKVRHSPDLSEFWEIGEQVRQLVPASMHAQIAVWQMGKPAASTDEFPPQWKENYMEVKETPRQYESNGFFGQGGGSGANHIPITVGARGIEDRLADTKGPIWLRARRAIGETFDDLKEMGQELDEIAAELEMLETNDALTALRVNCVSWGVGLSDAFNELEPYVRQIAPQLPGAGLPPGDDEQAAWENGGVS